MLDSNTAKLVIDHALSVGADFAELFVEKTQRQNIVYLNSDVDEIDSGVNFGIGVRLIYGNKVLYGYTNTTDADELLNVVSTLSAKDRRDPVTTNTSFNLEVLPNKHPFSTTLLKDVELAKKIEYLKTIDTVARAQSEKIQQVQAMGIQKRQLIEIFNSEGMHTSDERNYCRIGVSVIAKDGNEQQSSFEGPGALAGWEFADKVDPKSLAEEVARQSLIKLDADKCPAGKMPVVIDKGFGGVIFHEACGHLLETTSVAKKASVFHDKMGEMIAHEAVSAVDDGTLTNLWGSINIDDEGMPVKRTQLIKNGKLTSFMVDRVGSQKTGYERTGSGRRQSYKFAPTSRMRNTFIEPGSSSLDEMISSIDEGIYCKKMGGGSVSPGTGEFNFSAQESYLIKNGKIDRPLKSATLIGTGPEILKNISMVADNLDFSAGMCGSVSGSVPVTVGQAAIKVDNILVGGQQ